MKNLILFFLAVLVGTHAFAQTNSDSVAYQQERNKINAMLAQRTLKFGQYDQSLTKHSGIFGLQTKKDIRNSNDILMDIVKTDDNIYKELKILLDFRTFQQSQVQAHSQQAEDYTAGYITTINKLRNQVDILKMEATGQQIAMEKSTRIWIISLVLMSLLILVLFTYKRKRI